MELINIIYLLYGIPAMFAYILVLISVISLRKKFTGSFTSIFLISAAVNLITWFNAFWTHRFRCEPWFFWFYRWSMQPEVEGWRTFQQFLASYFYYAQNACAFIFTSNRFTAICTPSKHHEFWKRFHWLFQFLVHAISLAICIATRWPANADFVYNESTNAFVTVPKVSQQAMLIGMMSYGAALLFLCTIANSMCLYRLICFTSKNRKELSFSTISLCIFLSQAVNITTVIGLAICSFTGYTSGSIFISTFTPFTSDVFSLGPPVYTLLVPGPIRNKAKYLILKSMGRDLGPNLSTLTTVNRPSIISKFAV